MGADDFDRSDWVVGCVWGAHQRLVETLGDKAPTYQWCEELWESTLRKRSPAPAAVPGWLYGELFFGWRAEHAVERPLRKPMQLSLDLTGAP